MEIRSAASTWHHKGWDPLTGKRDPRMRMWTETGDGDEDEEEDAGSDEREASVSS